MRTSVRHASTFLLLFFFLHALPQALSAQSLANSGTIRGIVTDPTGAVVPGATVSVENVVSGYKRTATTDAAGQYQFANLPFNPYHMTFAGTGFASYARDADVRSTVPVSVDVKLVVEGATASVTVESGGDLIEATPTAHTDVDRGLFDRLPLESASSEVSSLVTLASPGIAADSNGLFHGLGDHAENSFSIDGQPITDQQSKVFSNQIPAASVQSMEVIEGAPPAEYGGKTSVVVNVTTRSGLGTTKPEGDVTASYGAFGTSNLNMDLAYGAQKWGNFISLGGLNTGRFLDPPEFKVLHDKGNEENFFDRLDLKLSNSDTVQLNLGFTRSWFQTPNSYDQQLQTCTALSAMCNATNTQVVNPLTGKPLSPTDQRSQIRTFNIAPEWTRLLGSHTVFTAGVFVRHDQYNYYPSKNLFSDLGPLQDESVSQLRFLTNAGLRANWSYVQGIHNVKVGGTFEHTFLTEHDGFGIVNPGLLSSVGCPAPATGSVTAAQCATLAPYDLTAGGVFYHYRGHTDVKEIALYAEDDITKGPWSFNVGLRGDQYRGLVTGRRGRQAEPRLGAAYNITKTNTVLRLSYARTLESPFNENLVLSSTGCNDPVVNGIMTVAQGFTCTTQPIAPGFRNEFHAGFEQAFSRHFVVSGEYIWKYTHNGYDFNVFGASPITLPIEWHNSKIPGFTIRASVPNTHGFTGFIVMSHVAARFFPPTVAGIAPPAPPSWFRIDHDEVFNQTTHLQYQPWQRAPWVGFNWRYDSGLVSGFVPCLAATATCSFSTSIADGGNSDNGLLNIPQGSIGLVNNLNGAPLTADQEFESGLNCNGVAATPTKPLPSVCPASQLSSNLIKIPAPDTEQDDHNPQRIAPRNLFDMSVGEDNLFHRDKYKTSLRLSAVNLGDKVALYNFLSTFSGTHYVTPRALTAEVGLHF